MKPAAFPFYFLLLTLLGAPIGCRKKAVSPRDYSTEESVSTTFDKITVQSGLRRVFAPGDPTPAFTNIDGVTCEALRTTNGKEAAIRFIIDPTFKAGGLGKARIEVEYFDATQGSFDLAYDSTQGPSVSSARRIQQKRTHAWETGEFRIADGRFENSQDANADFRLRIRAPSFFIRRVTVWRDTNATLGAFTTARQVSVTLGQQSIERGLAMVNNSGDGTTYPAVVDGRECRRLGSSGEGSYIYFALDRSFKRTNRMDVEVEVEYFDTDSGNVEIQYDGWNTSGWFKGPYSISPTQPAARKPRQWRTEVFTLAAARFENRQNGEADFRIRSTGRDLCVRAVTVRRL